MKIYLLLVGLLICTSAFSQDFIMKRKLADGYYNNFDFYKAIPMYEQLLRSAPNDAELYLRLATIFDHLGDSQKGEECYAFLVGQKDVNPELLLNYARALSKNGKYSQAREYYLKYKAARPGNPIGDAFSASYQHMDHFYRDSASFKITKAPFSLQADDFSPAYYGGSILFVSDRSGFSVIRSKYNWTQSAYLDLYLAKPDSPTAVAFSSDLNTPYHEGPVSFSHNQDTILFTRSNYYASHLHKSTQGINKLSLFQGSWNKAQKRWVNIHPLTLNSNEYSTEHPALSADGKELIFASDMPGGLGGIDLYVSQRITDVNGEPSWGVPVNLGPAINSPGDEVFPFVDPHGNLWYASNGIPGLGGLDIFFAARIVNGYAKTINPGYPLNTRFDDFGYITDSNGQNGYFSSNRNNNYQNDDIYAISRTPSQKVLHVYDAQTGENIPGFHLEIAEEGADAIMTMDNRIGDPLLLSIAPYKAYRIAAGNGKYKPGSVELSCEQLEEIDTIRIPLQKVPALILPVPQYNSGDIIVLQDIYYDLNKSNIRPDAELILDKLLKILTDNPKMKIELRSHTDSRSSAEYNLKLSDQRAKSAAAYLYSKGIAKDRIAAKGYGETILINKCADGAPCTEAEHQVNRRTEFKVLSN